MSNYPHCPKSARVWWDNGQYVAVVGRRNVARPGCTTRRDAILSARAELGLNNERYLRDGEEVW